MFFFKGMLVEDRDTPLGEIDRTKAIPLLRAYTVFNRAQIDGMSVYIAPDRGKLAWNDSKPPM